MTAEPRWFGTPERPLFGWVHAPDDGRIRGGIVLCPPIGYEAICAHRTMRVVAEDLASRGFAALRFDYDGTGDSAGGDFDGARLEAWTSSVDLAATFLRDIGATSISAIGMRIGALLAARAPVAFDALVLWDPVWSGKTFVRQLRALQLLGVEQAGDALADGAMAVAGTVFAAETIIDLKATTMPALTELDAPVLALVRADQPAKDADRALLPAGAEIGVALEQDRLLDGPSMRARVPFTDVARVVHWLDATLPPARDDHLAIPPAATAQVAPGVTERCVALGPHALFGIVSEPDDPVADGPVFVLLNNSIDHHVGPSRLWTDWGRRMAALGHRVARVDLSGIGDSPTRPGQPFDRPYPLGAVDDVVAMAAALDRGDGVVLGGLCSGSRNAIDAASVAPIRGVLAINPPLHASRQVIEAMSTDDPNPAALVALNEFRPIVDRIKARTPQVVFRTLRRLGLARSHAEPIAAITARGTDTLLIYGAGDFFGMIVKRTSQWHLDAIERAPGFRSVTVPELDHGLMAWAGRDEVARLLTEHVLATYGTRATTWNHITSATSSPGSTLRPSSRA